MLEQINAYLSGLAIPLLLCLCGIYYCVKLRFFHIRHPIFIIKELFRGGTQSAKALCLALAGTLGVGNIVGVASAIHLGGFGAVFWIWVSAALSMILKYAEIVLAMRHKRGTVGSAMYYIKDFFDSLGLCRIGQVVAAVFALSFVTCALTMGSMLQSGAATEALVAVADIPSWLVGGALAVTVFCVALGGTSRVSALTSALVPIMSLGYVVMSLAVIIKNRADIGYAFSLIFGNAFGARAAMGGIGGFAFMRTVRYGVMRGLVSNEAGCGTAPTAHATAQCTLPARQGIFGIFEVFTDTVILCTLSALVIILEYDSAAAFSGNYMTMCIASFTSGLGEYAGYFLAAAVLCFALATILCWVHYGMSAAQYLCPQKKTRNIFIVIYSLSVFIGCVINAELCWQLSDLSMSIMTLINLAVITQMSSEVRKETERITLSA